MSSVSHQVDLRERLIRHLDAGERLQAHFLITQELRRVKNEFTDEAFPITGDANYADVQARLQRYDEIAAPLLELAMIGCFGGPADMAQSWTDAIEFLAEYPRPFHQYVTNLRRSRWYPALLLAYGSGVAAVMGGNYEILAALLTKTRVTNPRTDEEEALPLILHPDEVLDNNHAKGIFAHEPEPHDLNGHLRRMTRNAFLNAVPSERKQNGAFDKFETFLALAYADLKYPDKEMAVRWLPLGRFHLRRDIQGTAWDSLKAEADTDGDRWPPLQAGLFRGSGEHFKDLATRVDQFLARGNAW